MGVDRLRSLWLLGLLLLTACAGGPRQTAEEVEHGRDERARAHAELGLRYFEAGKHQFAIEELNESLKARSEHIPALVGLALVYSELREDAKSEAYFKRAQRADRVNPMTQNNYGQFLCSRGRADEGQKLLLAAAANPLYETPDLAFKNAGLCARRAGDIPKAEEYFRQSVARNPRQVQSLYYLADIHYARGDTRQAKVYLDRAFQNIDSAGPEVLWLSVRTERRLGNNAAADRLADQLRRRFPEAPETRALLEGRYE